MYISHGAEVDLIIDRKHKKEWIEIKQSSTFHPRMMSVMHEFIEAGDTGYLVYQGENFLYHSPMSVLNYKEFLSVIGHPPETAINP